MKGSSQTSSLGVECTLNISDQPAASSDPVVLEDALCATQVARAVVMLLSRRSLEIFLQVSIIVVGMAASCTMIPVSTWDFGFPTATYYASQLPQLWPGHIALPVAEVGSLLRRFFATPAVPLATTGTEHGLDASAANVVSRIPRDYEKPTQESLVAIVRAIVLSARPESGAFAWAGQF
eukprot:3341191-Amphidinium_carterae.1